MKQHNYIYIIKVKAVVGDYVFDIFKREIYVTIHQGQNFAF